MSLDTSSGLMGASNVSLLMVCPPVAWLIGIAGCTGLLGVVPSTISPSSLASPLAVAKSG